MLLISLSVSMFIFSKSSHSRILYRNYLLFSTFLQFIIIFINKTYCCFYCNGFDLVMNIILIIFIPYVHILPYSIVFVLFFFFINLVRIPYDMYIVISLYVFIFLGFFLNFFFRWFGYFNNNIKRSKKKEMNK